MLALWMLYAMLVGALVTGAAALLDGRLLRAGRGRWVWGFALLAALAIPLVRPQVTLRGPSLVRLGQPVVVAAPSGVSGSGGAASLAERAEASLERWSGPIAGAWAGASAAILALLLWSGAGLRRRRLGWQAGELDGVPVLLSDGLGPALVGLAHPRIVVPGWVRDLDPADRAMILAHEEEHRRRRDPLALVLGLLAPVLCPWNPALWWGFSRLRHAVEADCDHRVLASGLGSPVRYARLLLDVGSRVVGIVPVSAGFGESSSSLERRIRTMLGSRLAEGAWSVTLRGAAALVLVLAACGVDSPHTPTGASAKTPVAANATAPTTTDSPAGRPVFTPYTVAPKILNESEVVQAMEQDYPPLLRDAGIGGTATVWAFVGTDGKVSASRVARTSGRAELDSAAVRVMKTFRFSPAMNKDKTVPVWVQVPITFKVGR